VGQSAFAVYEYSAATGRWEAHSIHVLAFEGDNISTVTMFIPPTGPKLFDAFGLPVVLPVVAAAQGSALPLQFGSLDLAQRGIAAPKT
jgi:hypothetical protein